LRWRAENLIELARKLVAEHDGRVPETEIELRTLPGVGDYVVQAVLCFGFGRRTALVDTTTARIIGRLNGRSVSNRRWQLRLDLHRLAGTDGPDAAFNYALLDLGALVCHSEAPQCPRCPMREYCASALPADSSDDPQLELELEPVATA
jgi:A/G-specific adenine glycosylase